MANRIQRGLNITQRTELWERWRQGEAASTIARALGSSPTSIGYIVHRREVFFLVSAAVRVKTGGILTVHRHHIVVSIQAFRLITGSHGWNHSVSIDISG
jgi:hypothetical protein